MYSLTTWARRPRRRAAHHRRGPRRGDRRPRRRRRRPRPAGNRKVRAPAGGCDASGAASRFASAAGRARLAATCRTCRLREPVALVIDDLHWADGDSLRALDELVGDLPTRPVALVLSMRDHDVPAPVTALLEHMSRRGVLIRGRRSAARPSRRRGSGGTAAGAAGARRRRGRCRDGRRQPPAPSRPVALPPVRRRRRVAPRTAHSRRRHRRPSRRRHRRRPLPSHPRPVAGCAVGPERGGSARRRIQDPRPVCGRRPLDDVVASGHTRGARQRHRGRRRRQPVAVPRRRHAGETDQGAARSRPCRAASRHRGGARSLRSIGVDRCRARRAGESPARRLRVGQGARRGRRRR